MRTSAKRPATVDPEARAKPVGNKHKLPLPRISRPPNGRQLYPDRRISGRTVLLATRSSRGSLVKIASSAATLMAVFIGSATVFVSMFLAVNTEAAALIPALIGLQAAALAHWAIEKSARHAARKSGVALGAVHIRSERSTPLLISTAALGAIAGIVSATEAAASGLAIAGSIITPVAWAHTVAGAAIEEFRRSRAVPDRAAIISMLTSRRTGLRKGE